jgi:hypothetical protein
MVDTFVPPPESSDDMTVKITTRFKLMQLGNEPSQLSLQWSIKIDLSATLSFIIAGLRHPGIWVLALG